MEAQLRRRLHALRPPLPCQVTTKISRVNPLTQYNQGKTMDIPSMNAQIHSFIKLDDIAIL